jgi:hypothetical protein
VGTWEAVDPGADDQVIDLATVELPWTGAQTTYLRLWQKGRPWLHEQGADEHAAQRTC